MNHRDNRKKRMKKDYVKNVQIDTQKLKANKRKSHSSKFIKIRVVFLQ